MTLQMTPSQIVGFLDQHVVGEGAERKVYVLAQAWNPGGFAILERALLAPFGFHLEPSAGGFLVARGAKFTEPVTVRPALASLKPDRSRSFFSFFSNLLPVLM